MKGASGESVAIDHGGSLALLRARFPNAPGPWIDLSTGINPHPYPLFTLPATALTRLPEPTRIAELAEVAARAYRAPSGANVTPAPGTQILLPEVARLLPPGKAAVLGPTYAEHARAAALAGHRVNEESELGAMEAADLAVVVNPNNPDGRIVPRSGLLELARRLERRGGLLVVDEAFMDVGPTDQSVAADVETHPIVVLRSFGKFYGLAGVRLGFAIASRARSRHFGSELGPWAIGGPALEYGLRALADNNWRSEARAKSLDSAHRLDAVFAAAGLRAVGGTALFRFFHAPEAAKIVRHLGERGIVVRAFFDRPGDFRVGLPGPEEDWVRLESALQDWARRRVREEAIA